MRLANMSDKEHVFCSGYRELRKRNETDLDDISLYCDDRSCVAEMRNSRAGEE